MRTFLLCLALSCILVPHVGCRNGDRPVLGRVKGVIQVNDQPAAGVGIIFSQAGFRSSSAKTNNAGEYELNYLKDVKGAVLGIHDVRIDYVSQEGKSGPQRLPDRFNRKTELTAEVMRGSNQIDFAVQSE